ncbi:MAG: hypothetical protein CMN01_04300 [Rickettsiales bacterium]|nr:hypothetical protein [Rickettsiales bacterium]
MVTKNYKDGISVIVTVYNKEKYILRTLSSVIPQLNKFDQIIIIDDGSTDKSLNHIKKKIQNIKIDFKLISQKNQGPSKAINTALKFVNCSFVKLVDGDDMISPDGLSYMKNQMNKHKLDLLYGYWEWSDNLTNFKFKMDGPDSRILREPLKRFLLSGWGGSSNLMIRTKIFRQISGCDEEVFVQDFSIPMRVAGFHLKKPGTKPFIIGQSDKTICVGPLTQTDRIMDNKGQTLYDLSLATVNFIDEHPKIPEYLKKKIIKKIIARCWSWEHRVNKTSYFSKNFLIYLKSKVSSNFSYNYLKLLIFRTWMSQQKIKRIDFKEQKNKKILIYVGLDLLGDALIKLPMLQHIKKFYPNSEITWLAGKGKSVYKTSLKFLADGLIHEVKDNANVGSKITELLFNKIECKYDIVIDTQKRFLTTLILKKINCDVFISSSCNYIFSDFRTRQNQENLSKQLIDLALLLTPYESYKKNLSEVSCLDRKKIAICPGASVKWKMWQIENFIKVGLFLKEKKFTPIFILGPNEKNLNKVIGKFFSIKKNIVNVIRPIDTINLAKLCSAGISNDTGCGHLLSSSGIPTLTIFGPTNYRKFAPVGNSLNVSISSQKIYKSKNINLIKVEDVISEISKILKYSRRHL